MAYHICLRNSKKIQKNRLKLQYNRKRYKKLSEEEKDKKRQHSREMHSLSEEEKDSKHHYASEIRKIFLKRFDFLQKHRKLFS